MITYRQAGWFIPVILALIVGGVSCTRADSAATQQPVPGPEDDRATDSPAVESQGQKPATPDPAAPEAKEDAKELKPLPESSRRPSRSSVVANKAVQAAVEEILARWDGVRSFSANVTTQLGTGQMIQKGPGEPWEPTLVVDGKGEYGCLKKDGKLLARMQMTSIGGGPIRSDLEDEDPEEYTVTRVSDGEFTYMAGVQGERKKAAKMKSKPNDLMQWGGKRLLDDMRQRFDLKLEGDEKINERQTYVILAKSKTSEAVSRHWFDKKTGVMVQMTIYGAKGRPRRVFTLDQISLDPTFPADHFTFVPPKGVPVEDLTNLGP